MDPFLFAVRSRLQVVFLGPSREDAALGIGGAP